MSNATYYANLEVLIRAEAGLSADTPIYFRRRPLVERLYPIRQETHRHSNRVMRYLTTQEQTLHAYTVYWHLCLEDERQRAKLCAQRFLISYPCIRHCLRFLSTLFGAGYDL